MLFDLRVPESMASLPGRFHELRDEYGYAEKDGKPLTLRQRRALLGYKTKREREFERKLYTSVMRDQHQCRVCGECRWMELIKYSGRIQNICKACWNAHMRAVRAKK